jgi:hypothetical protein
MSFSGMHVDFSPHAANFTRHNLLPGDLMTTFDDLQQQLDLLNDEELLSILREHDEEEWRPEVFDIVASILRNRGVSLTSAPEDEQIILDEPVVASADLITVASYFTDVDAETDRMALEAKGISAWIFNQNVSRMIGPVGGVELKVREEDFAVAMKILDAEGGAPAEMPDEIAEQQCPKCGSREVREEQEIVESLDAHSNSSSSTRSSPKEIWLYRCGSCGHEWSGS